MTVALFTHLACLGHDNGPGHPECPDRLRVVLLHEADRLRVLLFHEHGVLLSGTSASGSPLLEQLQHGWSALVSHHAGTLQVERVPGWGVLVLVDLPHAAAPAPPLTAREQEVLGLLARGDPPSLFRSESSGIPRLLHWQHSGSLDNLGLSTLLHFLSLSSILLPLQLSHSGHGVLEPKICTSE